ncbi:hypothetical protein ACVWZ4_000945 [Bradyrhizobium sp. USDA 4472]
MSFQLSILKILAGQPHGRASIEVVKQHLAIYYSSGPEWPARMKRIASRAPQLDIFGQSLIERDAGCWIISEQGRKYLETLEQLDRTVMQAEVERENVQVSTAEQPPPLTLQLGMNVGRKRPASD